MKEFLSRAGHTFDVKNVDEDIKAYDELIALGMRSVPVTVINGHIVKGFKPEELTTALAAGG